MKGEKLATGNGSSLGIREGEKRRGEEEEEEREEGGAAEGLHVRP